MNSSSFASKRLKKAERVEWTEANYYASEFIKRILAKKWASLAG